MAEQTRQAFCRDAVDIYGAALDIHALKRGSDVYKTTDTKEKSGNGIRTDTAANNSFLKFDPSFARHSIESSSTEK